MPEGPAGTRGRSERERAPARRAHRAESIDGAEPSASIEAVMAGRTQPNGSR
jgi:hypothetical protein